jgi:hypothetical protein
MSPNNNRNTECTVFGIPEGAASSTCYSSNGQDTCGDLSGNRNPVVCNLPAAVRVPCLSTAGNKLRLPWCVTYFEQATGQAPPAISAYSTAGTGTGVGPFITNSTWNKCFCAESECHQAKIQPRSSQDLAEI